MWDEEWSQWTKPEPCSQCEFPPPFHRLDCPSRPKPRKPQKPLRPNSWDDCYFCNRPAYNGRYTMARKGQVPNKPWKHNTSVKRVSQCKDCCAKELSVKCYTCQSMIPPATAGWDPAIEKDPVFEDESIFWVVVQNTGEPGYEHLEHHEWITVPQCKLCVTPALKKEIIVRACWIGLGRYARGGVNDEPTIYDEFVIR